jgi:hypothetical protein
MEIVLTILGAIIAALVTILVEYLRRPKLKLNIGPIEEQDYSNRPAKHKRALRLKLENLSLPKWASWMSRNPAMQCGGIITFHHLDGQNIFGRTMTIRWPDSPEPTPLTFHFEGKKAAIVDPARITLEQRMDIFPAEAELIDVVCRFDNDEECYGWNNESYFSEPLWKNPNWRLSKGRYLVRAIIFSSGQKCTELFRLINDVGIGDFRLEKALPEDYEIMKKADR